MRQQWAQPYYIGNSLAVDMLILENNECTSGDKESQDARRLALEKDFSILSAGCGNLRNVIHTMVSLPRDFDGKLHITMNDQDPFVQARNVLFLFMMIALADKHGIAGIITTLWYSLHISEDDFQFLKSCLRF